VSALRLVVTVGSDHHPFDRLVGWVDRWMDERHERVELVVQHGTAAPPRHGRSEAFLEHGDLIKLVEDADVVVLQGGPMGIVEARRAGHKPVVVPRLRSLGEVVDDHQVPFCKELARLGDVFLATSEREFHAILDGLLGNPAPARPGPVESTQHVDAAVRVFGDLTAALPSRRPLLPRALWPRALR
jgi:UDP-N-acetylglucosamine transferase subunit ALG13